MAEGQSCKEIPYLKWKIDNIDSRQMFKSPSFTVKGVKFRMVYHRVITSDLYEIYMEPEVGDSMLTIPTYSITASVSIISQDKECGDLRCTQKSLSINPNIKGNGLRHVLWLLRKKELLNIRDKIVGRNGMNDATFLCVFGPRSKFQKDVFEEEGTWCSKQCFLRLGKDLNKLRHITDSPILMKDGENEIKADPVILSARSEKFAAMVSKNMITEKEADVNIKFECLENFITYLYSGLLEDRKPSDGVLIQLYDVAGTYKVDHLREMVSFKLLEFINDPIFICYCNAVREEELSCGIVTVVGGQPEWSHIVEKNKFILGYHEMGLEYFASDVLSILAHGFENETFKEKVLCSIAKDYDLILDTRKWKKFCKDYSKETISEVNRAVFQHVKRYRRRL